MKIKKGILLKYLNGECSKKERARVQSWMAEDTAHSKEMIRLQKVWKEIDGIKDFKVPFVDEAWKKVNEEIINSPDSSTLRVKDEIIKPKSAIISPKPILTSVAEDKEKKKLESKATLPLASSNIANSIRTQDNPSLQAHSKSMKRSYAATNKSDMPFADRLIYSIAGLLVLGILAWGAWILFQKNDKYIEIATDDKERVIALSDGSNVHLRPFSRLSYPRLMGDNIRDLSLSGDALFDVVADSEPMIVEIQNLSIKTVGTEFEIKSEENFVTAECIDGKIRFYETENVDNGVEINKGQIFKYEEGVFENITVGNDESSEIVAEQEPDQGLDTDIRLDKLLDLLMEKSDWKVVSIPSMPIDPGYEVNIDIEQDYIKIMQDLLTKIDFKYEPAECQGCFIIKRMKSY